jgi:N-acetylneuraminic acid mutarotase
MIKRTAKDIRAHMPRLRSPRRPKAGVHWAAAIFVLLVLLATPLLRGAFGQRNSGKQKAQPRMLSAIPRATDSAARMPNVPTNLNVSGIAGIAGPQMMPLSIRAATGAFGVPAKPVIPHAPTLGQSQARSLAASLPRPFGGPGVVAPNLSPWSFVASYPLGPIEAPCVASDGTYAYSGGGFNGGGTNAFYRYDPVANAWTVLPNIPTALYATRGVYAANTNSFYIFGGYDGTSILDTTYIYNINTSTWTIGAPMPSGRYFPNVAYYEGNGKIYVIGGFNPQFSEETQVWEYDPVANTWDTSRAPIPTPMGGSGTSIVGQYIYLVGSWNDGAGSTLHYRNDILSNSWTAMAPLPVNIYEPGAAAVNTQIYIFGGGSLPPLSYTNTFIYDTVSNTWTVGPNMHKPRSFTAGTAIGTRLLVVGGYDSSRAERTDTCETADGGSTPTPTPTPTGTPTATPTPTPGSCEFRVLIVHADIVQPTMLQDQILAEPGVTQVDLFDAFSGTPTLGQLQQYDIVFAFSNNPWADNVDMGDVLADYEDGGGVVVVGAFAWLVGPWNLGGRWMNERYTPYNITGDEFFSDDTANITDPFHPLMQGVSSLSAFYRTGATLSSGAASVAIWTDGPSAIAYKTNNGRTAVGINAYLGSNPTAFSGDWGRVIVNAVRWLRNCQGGTPTPTPTATATATPTATPRHTPTPRPRPTPAPRP